MVSLAPTLKSLLKSLPPHPIDQKVLRDLVHKTISESQGKTSPENRKSQWEYLLKNDVFVLAATEGEALKDEETTYYDELQDKLDLILTFTEQEACEQIFPFIVLQDLLETQTISSCSHIFSWIEARAKRLTDGMVPQKGKALVLLRTLNDLLRRLSKMGSTTTFCGRILTFLSGVFPLGERSGVNLRGEYGPTWEGVKEHDKGKDEEKDEAETETKKAEAAEDSESNKMQVDDGKEEKKLKSSERKDDFYHTFWSLQLPFSKPPLFATPATFPEFRDAVNKVIPVIKEATAKERAMMGSRGSNIAAGSLKRKREPETTADETSTTDYFFAKFLTNPDLLDLEIADTHFRRQFLFQLLILLNHLLTFTKNAKSTWSTPRNRSLQMDFTLDGADAQWVQETLNKAIEELRQTTPNGRAFADTVSVILEREKNWVKWKNELCAPFDKEPWSVEVDGKKVDLEESTREVRKKMREEPKDWDWALGSEPLTEIWEMGYRDLRDLQNPFQPGDVKDFVKKVNLEDARIAMRQKRLAKLHPPLVPIVVKAPSPPPEKVEPILPPPAPTPTPPSTSSSSLLHPSLPPKPSLNTPSKPPLSESVRSTTPVPPIPAPVPPVTSTPAAAPAAVVNTAGPGPSPTPPSTSTPKSTDPEILKHEENKHRWAWLALRTARDRYLQHFGKIGTGDVLLLAEEIEKEKKEREEKIQKGDDVSGTSNGMGGVDDLGTGLSPMVTPCNPVSGEVSKGGLDELKTEDPQDDKMEL